MMPLITRCYAIAGAGLVKIGWAKDVDRRLRELQIGSPIRLTLLAVASGSDNYGRDLERDIHERQAAHHRHGEWFGPELHDFIVEAVEANCPPSNVLWWLSRSQDLSRSTFDDIIERYGIRKMVEDLLASRPT